MDTQRERLGRDVTGRGWRGDEGCESRGSGHVKGRGVTGGEEGI